MTVFHSDERGATVIRHKAYTPARQTPGEAITELELLGYDFYLFTDRTTGQDSVLYRTATGYRLAVVTGPVPGRHAGSGPALGTMVRDSMRPRRDGGRTAATARAMSREINNGLRGDVPSPALPGPGLGGRPSAFWLPGFSAFPPRVRSPRAVRAVQLPLSPRRHPHDRWRHGGCPGQEVPPTRAERQLCHQRCATWSFRPPVRFDLGRSCTRAVRFQGRTSLWRRAEGRYERQPDRNAPW